MTANSTVITNGTVIANGTVAGNATGYMIMANQNATQLQINDFSALLQAADYQKVYQIYASPLANFTSGWWAALNETQLNGYSSNPAVS